MGLPAEVAGGGAQHIVGEHGSELRADLAEGAGHGRIHGGVPQVGTVELVHDPREPRELGARHVGELIHGAQVVPLQLVACVQPRRIPPEAHAVRLRAPDRLTDSEILADVVEDRLAASRAPHRVDQRVDIAHRAGQVLGMVDRLVHQLDEQDGRLVLERDAGVGVHMPEYLLQVFHLRRNRGWVGSHAVAAVAAAESR